MTNQYYVYMYLDPLTISSIPGYDYEPFYVGKGIGRRKFSHMIMDDHNHKCHKIKKIVNSGREPIIITVIEGLSEEEALAVEAELILNIGTRSLIPGVKIGPLTNLKLDGVVQKYSDESKAKMSMSASNRIRKPHSPATITKMREKYASKTEGEKKKIALRTSMQHSGKTMPIEFSERMSKLHKGKIISESQRAAISSFQTGRKRTAGTCQLVSDQQKKTYEIEQEFTGAVTTVTDLKEWSKLKSVSYGIIHRTFITGKFNKGYRIIKKYGGTH